MRNGICEWKPGMIAWVMFIDGNKDVGYTQEMLFEPHEEDIRRLCRRFDVDEFETLAAIRRRDPEIHGVLFELEKYREYLKELAEKKANPMFEIFQES